MDDLTVTNAANLLGMKPTRRAFLGSLSAAAAVAFHAVSVKTFTAPLFAPSQARTFANGSPVEFQAFAVEALRQLVGHLNGTYRFVGAPDRPQIIGEAGLSQHWWVDLYGIQDRKSLSAATSWLASRITKFDASRFGVLQLPRGLEGVNVMDSSSGVCLRVLRDYQIARDRHAVQLSVLFG